MRVTRKDFIRLAASRSIWLWLLTIVASVFLVVFAGYAVVNALSLGVNFNGYAADGPFQLYNPLRRLADSQIPGVDFPFFHGIGVPLLHYIPFEILGGNIFGAEVSRWLVSPALFIATCFVFFYAALRSWRKSLIATAVATILAMAYTDVVFPSNSLIGIRTTFPMLAAAALMWPATRTFTFKRLQLSVKHIVAISCLVLAFVCGTEQGVAAIGAFLIVRTLQVLRDNTKLNTSFQIATEGTLIVLGILITLSVITLGHPFKPLQYGLVNVPQEQAWYFGAPPNFYLSWDVIGTFLSHSSMYPTYAILISTAALFYVARRFKVIDENYTAVGLFLLIYSILTLASMLGYFSPLTQLYPATRAAIFLLVGIIILVVFDQRIWDRLRASITLKRRILITGGLGAVLAIGLVAFACNGIMLLRDTRALQVRDIISQAKLARNGSDYTASNPDFKFVIDYFKPEIKPGATVWSTYSSIYESDAGVFTPSKNGEDYIIHALGEHDREAYNTQFIRDKPDYVITLRPIYFPFEEWLWSKSWPFYDQLFTHYTLVKENGMHYLWKYTGEHVPKQEWKPAEKKGNTYKLPGNTSSEVKVYEAKVSYTIPSGLPIFNKLPRHLIEPSNTALQYPISLPPYETEWTFVVPVAPGQTAPSLEPVVKGIVQSPSLKVNEIIYRELVIPPVNYLPFLDNFCASPAKKPTELCNPLPSLISIPKARQ